MLITFLTNSSLIFLISLSLGYVTRQQFTDVYGIHFTEIPTKPSQPNKYFVDYIFDSCDVNKDDKIDYVEWVDGLDFEQLHAIVSSSKVDNPFLKVIYIALLSFTVLFSFHNRMSS